MIRACIGDEPRNLVRRGTDSPGGCPRFDRKQEKQTMVHATVCRMFSLKMKIAYHAEA